MLYSVTFLRSIQDSHWLRCSDHKMNYDISLMVNSINHPEFKSTQTEIEIEVMLNFLEKIKTTSVFPLNQLHSTYSKKVHTSFIIVVKQLLANAVKYLFAGNLIVVFTRVVQYSIQICFATTGLHVQNMQKDTTRPKPG